MNFIYIILLGWGESEIGVSERKEIRRGRILIDVKFALFLISAKRYK